MTKQSKAQKPRPANYQGATPEQVGEAVLKYRPAKPNGQKLARRKR